MFNKACFQLGGILRGLRRAGENSMERKWVKKENTKIRFRSAQKIPCSGKRRQLTRFSFTRWTCSSFWTMTYQCLIVTRHGTYSAIFTFSWTICRAVWLIKDLSLIYSYRKRTNVATKVDQIPTTLRPMILVL